MALKENYKDDILDVSVNTKRKYKMTDNGDGTVSFDDETVYTQEGDSFGASDLNDMAHAINNIATDAEHTSYDNTTSGLQATNVQDAVDEINDNLTKKNDKMIGYGSIVKLNPNLPTSSNPYTFPSDGFLYVRTGAAGTAQVFLLDKNGDDFVPQIDVVVSASSLGAKVNTTTIPVFKDMKCYASNTNIDFNILAFIPYAYQV